jgi:hypothetical protein
MAVLAVIATPTLADTTALTDAWLEGREAAARVIADMDEDGRDEVLVTLTDQCDDAGCDWSLLTDIDGKMVEILTGHDRSVAMVGEIGNGYTVDADGTFWAWSGEEATVYPYYSLLERDGISTIPSGRKDLELIAKSEYATADTSRLNVWLQDIDGDGTRERIIVIAGVVNMINGNLAPYVIGSDDGDVLVQGYSMDFPRIFTTTTGGSRIVDVMGRTMIEHVIAP